MPDTQAFDLIVVGGGIAGLAAANRAAEQGLRVVLLERGTDERYLCNSRLAGGVLHVAFRNIRDRPEALIEAVRAATKDQANPDLTRALAHTSARAGEWIKSQGVKFVRMSLAVDWQSWVMAPPRRIMAGMDWYGRGADYTLRLLARNLLARGGRIIQGAAAVSLMERAGACVGVEIRRQGDVSQLPASAVVLADGGFQGNLALLGQHISGAPEKLKQRGAATGVGDGLRMAQAFGAEIADLSYFYGHLLSRDAFDNPRTWPYPQLDELGVAGVMVGADGRRFADEGLGGVQLANAVAKLEDPLSAWAVFDSAIWEGPGRNARIPVNPHLVRAGGTIIQADTLAELASRTGLPAQALQETIAAHRQAVISGQFQQLDPPRSRPAGQAWAVDHPPYFAAPVCAGITYTMGGIAIDEHARVRSTRGVPVAGLYAAGANTAGLEGRQGATYIGGLMKGLVFGIRAAEHVAKA
ncbi:FAD-dependent oxidoreductase [Verticiella sediminum]|nr:FAD-dependent oxidoreductase [Verticiella sediminum]